MSERWVVLPEGAPEGTQAAFAQILAVHAALLHTGKVLYFGGSEHVLDNTLRSVDDPRIDNTRIWDAVTGAVTHVSSPQPSPAHLYDLFCCGHAFLPDGRLVVGGGTSAYPPGESDHHHEHYRGSRRTSIFNPVVSVGSPWIPAGEMIQPSPSDVDPARWSQRGWKPWRRRTLVPNFGLFAGSNNSSTRWPPRRGRPTAQQLLCGGLFDGPNHGRNLETGKRGAAENPRCQ